MQDSAKDILQRSVRQLYPEINKAALDYLLVHSKTKCFKAKEEIITTGERQKSIYFLTSGLVRGFYVDQKGDEITIRLLNNVGWVTHYSALISNTPSRYIFQTLEECDVVEMPFRIIQEGYLKFPALERFGRLVAESVLKSQQARIESFQFLDAEGRYLEFITKYPELFNRVSLSHLSTYLGIQRQSLSRIRKKIAKG